MAITKENNVPVWLLQAIEQTIAKETERLMKEATEGIKKEMERRTPEIIAGIIVDVMQLAEFQTMNDRVVFTIHKPK